MSDIQKVYDFLNDAETYYLATVDGDQPRVRPFGTVLLSDGKIYIQTGKSKDVSKSRQNLEKKLQRLKSIQLSYEFQLDVTTKKENRIKQKDILTIIFNIIKIIQGFVFLFTGIMRCFLMDYSYYNGNFCSYR